tara:strand:+ start:13385 stop:28348 length:14964 start_codon:yes stop_codon:yes gene_type:complete
MAQDEKGIPIAGDNNQRKTADMLPRYFRTTANNKFLSSTLDQLMQPGVVEKVDGFIGRRDAKAWKSSDNYLSDVSNDRENYQLEPVATITDNLGNNTFYRDYRDYINSIKIRNGDTSDHSTLNAQEYYAWDPHINWDKFVNFREYYWLPTGPNTIPVYGSSREIQSTFSVRKQNNVDNDSYIFSKDNAVSNPTLTLYKGQTYTFDIDCVDMPFSIRTSNSIADDTNLYTKGVSQNNTETGTVTWTIDLESPDTLFYVNSNDNEASGLIIIKNIVDNTYLNVGEDILDRKTYKMQNGYELANGMRLEFVGDITPTKYATGTWYVEGVGEGIKLVSAEDVGISASYLADLTTQFDNTSFDALPFDDAISYANKKDYIVINKQSKDRNQWSRYNLWTHKSVLETTAAINGTSISVDQNFRATRPIIEFEAGLKLYNFGTEAKVNVDLVDTVTTDVFSDIEGQAGYFVDGTELVSGMRVLFTADPDTLVAGKIYEVTFIKQVNKTQIALKETTDTAPQTNETVLVKAGTRYKGKMFYYTGTTWKLGQDKIGTNQQPLFDLYNDSGTALSTLSGSTFTGNKIFSYKVGTGTADTELGFALSYRTIENSGDITFDFNLLMDTYQYDFGTTVLNVRTDTGLLRKYQTRTAYSDVSGWTKAKNKSSQPVVLQYTSGPRTNNFIIDSYEKSGDLNDLTYKVYVDNIKKVENIDFTIDRINSYAYVRFYTDLSINQKVVIETKSATPKNSRGYYKFPTNLEKNPMNENITDFTFGEVLDHVDSIVDEVPGFLGTFPGNSNLGDLGLVSKYGLKFVQHSGPINLALYNLTNKEFDMVEAIKYSNREYIKFKREFLRVANDLGFEAEDKQHVDKILLSLTETKTNKDPFYFSDMIPFGGDTTLTYEIEDISQTIFPLTRTIDFTTLNENAILVYLDQTQLIKDKDYTVSTDGFITITATITAGQKLYVYEYESTDGCWVPPTPTKLGLYPKYQPEVYLDDTYITAIPDETGPYKIYGIDETTNLNYKNKLGWFYPLFTDEVSAQAQDRRLGGTGVAHTHTFKGYNRVFYMPSSAMSHATYDTNSYPEWPSAKPMIQGHDGSLWRCFGDYRDKLLLDLEKRIFNNLKQEYDESVLDVADFVPSKNRNTNTTRQSISKLVTPEFNEWLATVGNPDATQNISFLRGNSFSYNYSYAGDPNGKPVAGFWRAIYKDFYNTDRPHSHPWEILGYKIKPSWFDTVYGVAPYTSNNLLLWEDMSKGIVRQPNTKVTYRNKFKNADIYKYIPVNGQGNLISPLESGYAFGSPDSDYQRDLVFGDEGPTETAWRRSSSYPFALIKAWALTRPAEFFGIAFDRSRIKRNSADQLVYTDTSKRIELDQLKFPNSASDTARINTAGIVNYMQGYLSANETVKFIEYQNNLKTMQNNLGCKIGGFSQKSKFRLILDSRTPTNEGNIFVPEENYKLVLTKSVPLDVYTYSGILIEKLTRGFKVSGYDLSNPFFNVYPVLRKGTDPVVNVGGVSEDFLTWAVNKTYDAGQIVKNGNQFYRVLITHDSGTSFISNNYDKIDRLPVTGGATALFAKNFETNIQSINYGTVFTEIQDVIDVILGYSKYLETVGFEFNNFNETIEEVENWQLSAKEFMFWSTQGWDAGTVLTLSPSARQIQFEKKYTVVDDIYDNFYDYSLLQADGKRLLADFATTERDNSNKFGIQVRNTEEGIYQLKIPVIQNEHAIILDNQTVFSDKIYNRAQGYRQERIKVKGYRSADWNGSLNIPGFIFDDAVINEWTEWQDYKIGDIVKHKQYYYVAKTSITGNSKFIDANFVLLNEKPEQKLLPNLDYKAKQFADFYDLDSDNFDLEQQKLAQHLTSYQKRKYLENIIPDEVSQYKFFQGMIQDKGTKNVLNKLFDKLGSANKESLEFYEEWAVRAGRYGATQGDDVFEILLDESKYRLDPQEVELVDVINPQDTSLIYKLDPNNIFVKSQNYDHKPFPTKYFGENDFYVPNAGYVNPADVYTSVTNYNLLINQTLSSISEGSYFWTAKEKNQLTWGVYKYITTDLKIDSLTASNADVFTVTLNKSPNLEIGDVIGINDIDTATDGLYTISDINLNVLSCNSVSDVAETDATVYTAGTGFITKFKKVRVANLTKADENIKQEGKGLSFNVLGSSTDSDTIWVDDDDTGKWVVLKSKQVYELKPDIKNIGAGILDSTDKDFGSSVSVTSDNNLIAITAPKNLNGSVYIYGRPSDNAEFNQIQEIFEETVLYDSNGAFGTSTAISPDGKYLAIGSPKASNVKTAYKGDYTNTTTYSVNEIVLYSEQLWKAKRLVQADALQFFSNHASNQQSKGDDYNTISSSYPTISYMLRGNPSIASAPTDHILIRAEKEQFEGTKSGDTLTLKWNRYTTNTPSGIAPFNGDTVLTESYINGDHEIIDKVEAIVKVISALATPEVGDEINTGNCKAIVQHRYIDNDNNLQIYLKNINGQLDAVGTITTAGITVGSYTREENITDNYHAGWWYINVGYTFTGSNIIESNANLVVQDITLQGEVQNTPTFSNILDTKQNENTASEPTKVSYFGVLSHVQGGTSINLIDSRWVIRTPLSHGNSFQTGDKFRIYLNDLYSNGTRQDPSDINLPYTYINDTEHTVADKWNGWTEARLTNFDLSGNPFIPTVGQTITDTATGSTATVAYIERSFATARFYLKNKSGTWSKGSDYNESSNVTFIENDSTVRTVGPINNTHHENSISGPLLVIDKTDNIQIPNTRVLENLEYWLYSSTQKSGITESSNPPGPTNLDWTRVYNIPLIEAGTQSANTIEGAFGIYERKGATYTLVNFFTVPNSDNNRQLGNQLKFRQSDSTTYKLYVHAKGNETEVNQGRIYIIDKNATDDWSLGNDNKYRGFYKNTATYYTGDLVRVGDTIYESSTNLVPGVFVSNQWTVKTDGVDLLGYVPNDTNFALTDSVLEQTNLEEFGEDFDISTDGSVMIANARYLNVSDSSIPNRKIVVYRKNGSHYQYSQLLEAFSSTEDYATTIAISNDGKKIAVGAPLNSEEVINGGCVYLYVQSGTQYVYKQTLRPVDKTPNTRFGAKLDFDGNTLAINSKGGDLSTNTSFDLSSTTYDGRTTEFKIIDNDSGVVSIYETVNDTLIYGQDFTYNSDTQEFGSIMVVKDNHIYLGLPKQGIITNNTNDTGIVAEYRKPAGTSTWSQIRQPVLPADTSKFKGIFLFNKLDNSLVTYLDYIDPLQGKIAGPAEQEISFKTSYDPAKFSISTATGITAQPLDYTAEKWVGKLWWDIGSAKFINHHQGNITESTQNFNKLFTGTTVDVYEWVQSTLLPSEWDTRAGTEAGLTLGISGTTKYGDTAYSVRRIYDEASQTFSNNYYYWVKDKRTLPTNENRQISGFDVARYISNPSDAGYRFVAILGSNRFSIYNCEDLIQDKDIGISFNWWTIDNQTQNTHNQYQLLTDGLETSVPNTEIEQKWFDSLIGFDTQDRPVPDINLPMRKKYGNLNEPRQSWFVNKTEARKEFVERTNKVLKQNLIVDDKDISGLSAIDPQPTVATGRYDTTSDNYAQLSFVSVARVKQANITLEVENGNVVNALIIDAGAGYINPPSYVISDTQGSGCSLTFTLDANGSISAVTIDKSGQNYTSNISLTIRKFSVLVKNDETVGGKWAIFAWSGSEWLRTKTQSFDVSAYWQYIDWYKLNYNQFTPIDFTVESSYQLSGLDDNIGNVVKIRNVGTGGWLLLQKTGDTMSSDYTVNYDTIGRENGTIEFKNSLYDVSNENIAYDGASFDKIFYDTEPVEEFRRILSIVKNKIFTDDLGIHWNNLFFASLRYVFSEQPNVDWAFKTSYIKAKHNVGSLTQKVNFQNDNLSSYESYVQEIKPYKTKIREYLSSYEKIDPSASSITDFDLPPVYNVDAGKIIPQSVQIVDNKVVSGTSDITNYPSKHWVDNIGFELTSLTIADAGSGYNGPPKIKITGGGGSGAEAKAYIGTDGKVTAVEMLKTGSGYLSQPTIEVQGSQADGSITARVSPVLGKGKARAVHVVCKFDRTTGVYLFNTLSETQTFTATNDQQIFNVKWPMQLKSTKITVTVDGLESLRSEYTFTNIKDTSKGYTRNYGRIFFTAPQSAGSTIIITYDKAPDLLQAQDRINLYYNPATGMFGKELGQVMDGIDYGGVEVSSYSFGTGTGWDSDNWFTGTYDTFDTTYDDEIFQLDGSTEVFALTNPLANGVVYNIYRNGVRIDDPNFGTASQTNTNAVMQSITGDGTTTTVTITKSVQSFQANDVVVIRKTTSDGSFLPDPRSYDTLLSGGDLQFTTAKGINPEDIVIDGDGFVTPTTSKGPEEQVPGQILDSVDIKVFHRPKEGGSLLSSNSYNADGSRVEFAFGIQPQNKEGLIVRVNDIIQAQNLYTVDYRLKTIRFNSAPTSNVTVNIISVSGNGENVVEADEFIGDGSTTQFLTKARWTSKLDYYATVNGVAVESVLIPSTDSTDEDAKAIMSFGSAPPDNSIINFAVYSAVDNFSKIETQEFTGDGSSKIFTLNKTPYSAKPNSHNVIVKQGNKILNPGYNQQFTVSTGVSEYFLEIWQRPIGSFDNSDVLVLLNGKELTIATEYNIRPANSSVILEPGIGSSGDTLEVYIRTDGEYAFGSIQVINNQNTWVDSGADLQFTTAPAIDEKITVYTFNKHDSLDFERINYDVVSRSTLSVGSTDHIEYNHLRAGLVKLRKLAVDAQFVWLTVNGVLKTPSVDYKLTDDKLFVKYNGSFADNDVIELIHFSSDGPQQPKFGFSQFKDILNRNIYKRLGDISSIKLIKPLLITDKEIHLDNTINLSAPDKTSSIPGIIFINGERITYLVKTGNVLKQLQRGTLGTGVPTIHNTGSDVYNANLQQTAPYADSTITENFTGDGSTSTFILGFTPNSANEFEVFVAGKRLRKNAISVFDATKDQDSPEADVISPAEFSVTGSSNVLTLTNIPTNNAKIQVIRKQGKRWTDPGISLNDAESLVARFFKAEKVELPK